MLGGKIYFDYINAKGGIHGAKIRLRAGYADKTEHIVKQVATLAMSRMVVMYQNNVFGKAGLVGEKAAVTKRKMQLVVAAPYQRMRTR
ncbi:MAG: hypothetical protein H7293_04235 [Candidatus Saccharibacteria bacterium]|nr:hypothetical protein [Rhodoferax sp.]